MNPRGFKIGTTKVHTHKNTKHRKRQLLTDWNTRNVMKTGSHSATLR